MKMSFCPYVLYMHYVSTASYYTLAEVPGVAREFFFEFLLAFVTPGIPLGSL